MPELIAELPRTTLWLRAYYLQRADGQADCMVHFRSRETLLNLLDEWAVSDSQFLTIQDELGISHTVDPSQGIREYLGQSLCFGCAGKQAAQ